ncbi:acylneuraminate cytidylyltransferase [Halarcobacter ebronensis]|uniref:N-acylneuraminate cytidylyltransferase n=1 Tax=Halarcobacter ebronensis TaxID=1462615 RepID=A0A4Q1AXI6_9BACT|nr:acylneuraminate cytidylyltransferase [Halarcobacter ebronensis]QKF83323.1 acylneuraminate cytidylyltransferase family protein [Halarcobacter ebronensis]RXK05885.1 acylneuraminate cytidylyltransferase [Halarcobacter ebronensis]
MNIAFIPVRCGSKSIPFKNIKEFCGKPLVYWNLKAIEESKYIDIVYVATDCDEIAQRVKEFKFKKSIIYKRDEVNARDTSSTEDVMLEFLRKHKQNDEDLFLLVQATSPLTQSQDFDKAIEQLEESKKDSLLTVVNQKRFFWNKAGESLNYDYKKRPRRQDFEGYFLENGAFYINRVKNILESKNRLSGEIDLYIMADYTSVEIDETLDWQIAENLMREHILKEREKEISKKIKLFLSDVDGTLTDAGMYYGENGEEFKKFNTHDGKGFELLRKAGIKTGLITSEKTKIVENRAKKLKVDYLYQGVEHGGKLKVAKKICEKEGISLDEVAYIGDDINCKELLEHVGIAACPSNSLNEIKEMYSIINLTHSGGDGAVREFIDLLIQKRNI